MSTLQIRRELTAFVALTSLICAQGCYVYQRPSAAGLPAGTTARIQSRDAFVVRAGDPSALPADTACRVTYVEGVVDTVGSDTLTFRRLTGIRMTNGSSLACPSMDGRVVVVPPDQARVTLRRYSGGRTLLLVAGLAVVTYFALVAYAMANMDWSSGSSGGWGW